MERKEMTCIRCPLGCALTATIADHGEITVSGNTCPRGAEYAKNELTNPMRTVTSTVRINGRRDAVVSVKTKEEIPKGKISACMEVLKMTEVSLPICIGDVILANVADTGVDVVATKNYNE